jgi:NodT family efflux transporter outer membrane factor (OMF) lipoprotein
MSRSHMPNPRSNRSALAAAGSLLLCAGCTVGPDFAAPNQPTPAAFAGVDPASQPPNLASTPVASAPDVVAWWNQFNDPALSGLISRAAQSNLTLAQAETRIRQARAARVIAASGLFPSVDASASATRARTGSTTDSGDHFSSTRNLFREGFDATWEIDIFGGVRRGIEAADAQVRSAILDRQAVLVSLAGELATNYLQLRGAQQQLAIANRNLAAQQETLDITQQRLDAGFVSALDVAQAKSNVTQTASQIPGYEAQIRTSIYAISVLLGQTPDALLAELLPEAPFPAPPATVPVGLPSDLLLRRPDLRRAEADLHAATARVGVAVADQYPKFFLTGGFGLSGSRIESLTTMADRFWSIGPSVSVPVFTAGRNAAAVEQAKAVADEALLTYRGSVLTALQDVETALVNFTREQQRRVSLTEALAANREAVALSLELYSGGRTTFLDVLTAQRALFNTEASLSQSQTTIGTNLVALYKALGGGWNPSDVDPPNPAPPTADQPSSQSATTPIAH